MKDKKKLNSCQKNAQELAVCMHNKRRAKLGKEKETTRRAKVAKDKETTKAKENREREQKMKKQHVKRFDTKKKDAFDTLGYNSDDYLFKTKRKKKKGENKNTHVYEQ
jgi:hypothetical protein